MCVYIYIYIYIYICVCVCVCVNKGIFEGNILNVIVLIYLHTVEWFQVLLCNTNNSV